MFLVRILLITLTATFAGTAWAEEDPESLNLTALLIFSETAGLGGKANLYPD